MLVNLGAKRERLTPGGAKGRGAATVYHRLPAGEDGFCFPEVTLGFVLNASPRHRGAFGTDGRVAMPFQPGMGWVLPAGLDGSAEWGNALDFLNIHLDPALFDRIEPGARPEIRMVAQLSDPTIVTLALNLHEAGGQDDAVSALYRDSLALALGAHVLRSYAVEATRPETEDNGIDHRLQRAVDYIEANIAADITLDDIAAAAAMSPFHFARRFKAALGAPPHRYLLVRRIERAKVLLRTTKLPVVEVAFRVGYENISHFTQIFRRLVGQTPGAFRAA